MPVRQIDLYGAAITLRLMPKRRIAGDHLNWEKRQRIAFRSHRLEKWIAQPIEHLVRLHIVAPYRRRLRPISAPPSVH